MKKTNASKIAIAHNICDNAETVFMNLIRGSGVSGLKGIEPKRNEIIRPLIECNKEEINQYCSYNKIIPRHDESNDENIYTRNKVRNELIPYIKKEFNPNIIDTLNRVSKIILDEEKYFIKILKEEYNNIMIEELEEKIVIDLKKFNKLDIALKRRMILYIINNLCGTVKDIGMIHVEDILKMCDKNIGNKFLSPKKGLKIQVGKGKVEYISYKA